MQAHTMVNVNEIFPIFAGSIASAVSCIVIHAAGKRHGINANMADCRTLEGENVLNLKANAASSEHGEKFWNNSAVALKFEVEVNWQKKVRNAKNKPVRWA